MAPEGESNALSTINFDFVDWTTYLQTSVRGGGFYKDSVDAWSGSYKDFASHP